MSDPAPSGLPKHAGKRYALAIWWGLLSCVVIGSVIPRKLALNATRHLSGGKAFYLSGHLVHVLAYFATSFLAMVAFPTRRAGTLACAGVFGLGVLMEVAQHFSPGRSPEITDVAVNGCGVLCGLLLARLANLRNSKPETG